MLNDFEGQSELNRHGYVDSIAKQTEHIGGSGTLHIALATTVTDETPGPPQILAVSTK